jgi:hypothetical protein
MGRRLVLSKKGPCQRNVIRPSVSFHFESDKGRNVSRARVRDGHIERVLDSRR